MIKNRNLSNTELLKTNDRNGEVEQEWVAIYNGVGSLRSDEASDIVVDFSGNVYVTGYSESLGYDFDCATVKYDAHGEVLWINRYDGGYYDWPYKLVLDDSGNVYITGYSESLNTDDDYLTIKYNTDGVEQWVRKYNGPGNSIDRSNDIAVDDSGNVYVTGESNGLGTYRDYATIKYNSLGIEQWVKRYNGPQNGNDYAVAIAIDNMGYVLVTGRSIGINNRSNFATIKYSPQGVELWVQRFSLFGNYSDIPYDIAIDNWGNVIVTGTGSSLDSTSFAPDYLTIKYDSSGMLLWTAQYNGTGNDFDEAFAICVDDEGNVYTTGISVGEGWWYDITTIKYDYSGIEQWVNRFNSGFVYDLALDKLGNVYVTGVSSDSTTIGDYTTIKYDTYGVQQWFIRYNGPGDGLDGATAITLDQFDNIYVTGFVEVPGSIPSFDFATVKYKQRIVPVELTNFTASVTDNYVILNWQTATEMNNSGFDVERIAPSVSPPKGGTNRMWEKIGFVPGFGTTIEIHHYSFIDESLQSGKCQYRLKQIDFDGSYEYSSIVEVTIDGPTKFSLEQNYPNPFNSTTIINYSIAEPSRIVLKLYNTLGEEVAVLVNAEKDAGKYSLKFNAQGLPSGVYLYNLNASVFSGKYNFVKKFILLK